MKDSRIRFVDAPRFEYGGLAYEVFTYKDMTAERLAELNPGRLIFVHKGLANEYAYHIGCHREDWPYLRAVVERDPPPLTSKPLEPFEIPTRKPKNRNI